MRYLTTNDIPQALDLSASAGWNQVAQDWLDVIEPNPFSCFAIECDQRLAATATLLIYEQRLAWLGMVLTKPEFRRRGFARMLVERALAEADGRAIQTVKLDATLQGQPLYESLGFVAEQNIERWSGTGSASTENIQAVESNLETTSTDLRAYLADRGALLERLARRHHALRDGEGFVIYRAGLRSFYLGPCLARSGHSAERLIVAALNQYDGPWLWDLLPSNAEAITLATRFGFRIDRRLVRMYRGAPLRGDESMIYAGAGFEFG